MQIYVCGVHTDAGKTHFCAAFCAAFKYDYFKLIQAGIPTDSTFIAKFSPQTKIFKEGVFLQTPASPHIGKRLEKLDYKAFDIKLPQSENALIETAGGLFTPIDERFTMLDYINKCKKPCILVAKYYLGVINHILLSLEALKKREIPLIALVMMGERDESIDEFIKSYAGVRIFHLPFYTTEDFLEKSKNLREQMQKMF
ncbi:ATP-dependent dethiobiotin synthetase BioD [Helicobacter mastomyrinus]|uniref:ATP-dependent dethiobiotin synthetase BioD n=2 Tax=Helicobacter TaxID=209 RepID=A0ABZ3F6W4_9HELI|nr:ATP-dependent dethiobiotin synthetase BioD [uncultured Helicobacter sp.]